MQVYVADSSASLTTSLLPPGKRSSMSSGSWDGLSIRPFLSQLYPKLTYLSSSERHVTSNEDPLMTVEVRGITTGSTGEATFITMLLFWTVPQSDIWHVNSPEKMEKKILSYLKKILYGILNVLSHLYQNWSAKRPIYFGLSSILRNVSVFRQKFVLYFSFQITAVCKHIQPIVREHHRDNLKLKRIRCLSTALCSRHFRWRSLLIYDIFMLQSRIFDQVRTNLRFTMHYFSNNGYEHCPQVAW